MGVQNQVHHTDERVAVCSSLLYQNLVILVVFFSCLFTMLHHCCVPECTSDSTKQDVVDGRPVSFHSFPSDPGLVKEWIVKIGRDVNEHFSLHKRTKVCSLHFTEDSFYPGDHRRSTKETSRSRSKLRLNAVPTMHA